MKEEYAPQGVDLSETWRGIAATGLWQAKLQVAVSAGAAVVLGFVAQRHLVHEHHLDSGLWVWGVAAALFLFALWRARVLIGSGAMADPAAAVQPPVSPILEVALFGAVMAVGIFFRFYKIGSIPPGLNHDAAWEGLYAIKITRGIDYAPYVAQAWGRETMFFYIVAFFQLFMGPTKMALQVGSISIGIATLGAMYIFVRRLFDTRTALIATFLLGISGWHLTLSKVGWREILVPMFIPLIFYFLVKAVEERRIRDFAIAGALLGLSLDTYDAARVLPFTAAAYIGYEIICNRSLVTKNYLHLAAFGVAAAIAFSPLGWYAYHHWQDYTGRGRFLWIGAQIDREGSLKPLFINIKAALLLFNFRANGDDFFTREPLLDIPLSVFFPLGLVIAATRVRRRPYFLLLIMLGLDLVVGVSSKPNGNRDLGAVIPIIALAAVFLVEAWRWLVTAFPAHRDQFSVVLLGALLYGAWVSYDNYLGPDHRTQWGFYPETTRVGRYMHGVPADYDIYAAAGNWPRDALTYLSYQGHGDPSVPRYKYSTEPTELLTVQPQKDKGTVFIVENLGDGPVVVDTLQRRYPTATVDDIHYPEQRVVARAVTVPPSATAVTDTGAPYIPPGGLERDAKRRADLLRITAALLQYKEQHGSFPDTGGNAKTACAYKELDPLCQFESELGADTLVDPRRDTGRYGYWYTSDGASFIIFATFEGPIPAEETCIPKSEDIARKPNLFCAHVGD
jgi:hypothetical protein